MVIELTPVDTNPPCCPAATLRPEDEDHLAHVSAVFKALSDPTRLRILKAVAQLGELCECNMVPSFGLSQPTVNYHLKTLREAGLIRSERRGQWVYHRVVPKAVLGAVRELTEIG